MDNAGYVSLTRQSGLLREMHMVANNIANISTTGYQKEGLLFAEYVNSAAGEDGSLSMANGDIPILDRSQGSVTQTGNHLDLAIEGDGYFMVQTPDGFALTRAGNFTTNADGEIVAPDGARLLDDGQAPFLLPPIFNDILIANDGTLSVDGEPYGQVGVFTPADPADLARQNGVRFSFSSDATPVEEPTILQGFVEGSNVNPVKEIARMIEVQHAYELGQKLLDQEDQRIRNVLQTLGK